MSCLAQVNTNVLLDRGTDNGLLTLPDKWTFVAVHHFFRRQVKVGHAVALHGREGVIFCYLVDDFLTQITAQEIGHFPQNCTQVLREKHIKALF